jgi:hypothetical protein
VPPTEPISFDRIVSIGVAVAGGRPRIRIFIVGGSRELGTSSELQHLTIVGIGDVHDPKRISVVTVHGAASVFYVLHHLAISNCFPWFLP